MKIFKKFITAIVLANILTSAMNTHAMNEVPKKATTQFNTEGLAAILFRAGYVPPIINEAPEEVSTQEAPHLTYEEQNALQGKLLKSIYLSSLSAIISTIKAGAFVNKTRLRQAGDWAIRISPLDTAITYASSELNKGKDIGKCIQAIKALVVAGANTCSTSFKTTKQIEIAFLEAQTTKQRAIDTIQSLKKRVRNNLTKHPDLSIEQIAQIYIAKKLPHFNEPEYELLNDFVAREWTQIKKELEIDRIIEQSFLPACDIVDIVDGYAFDQHENYPHQAATLTAEKK